MIKKKRKKSSPTLEFIKNQRERAYYEAALRRALTPEEIKEVQDGTFEKKLKRWLNER